MQKFEFMSTSSEGNTAVTVTADFVADRIANRSIGMIAIADDGTGFGFSLSDGSKVKIRLRGGRAEIVYYTPSKG